MKKLFLCAALLASFAISGCGNDASEATPPASASATSSTPQVGDKIPAPPANGGQSRAGIQEIGWEDLMPEGEEERIAELYQQQMESLYSSGGIAEGSVADKAVQIGTFNVVEDMDGRKVRLPGYTVPFQYGSDAEISEFLLVPYYGACLHAPPPPPNQTIFVKTDDPIQLKDLSQAVWIEGTLRVKTRKSDLADTAYVIEMSGWEKYKY